MTFQEQFEKLFHEYSQACLHFFEMDKVLSQDKDPFNVSKLDNFEKAKIEMQKASDKYQDFLALLNDKNINPNDEYRID